MHKGELDLLSKDLQAQWMSIFVKVQHMMSAIEHFEDQPAGDAQDDPLKAKKKTALSPRQELQQKVVQRKVMKKIEFLARKPKKRPADILKPLPKPQKEALDAIEKPVESEEEVVKPVAKSVSVPRKQNPATQSLYLKKSQMEKVDGRPLLGVMQARGNKTSE